MDRNKLQLAIRLKCIELETAMETGMPRKELLRIYKELKDLKFKLLEMEIKDAV